ncbi:hypothetical protein [Acidovorax sp.]|uniref:hypothetical protein n=1 Tax=Acidovorax sp. TaxID=1872122 RepID=UPI00391F25A6
MYFEQWRHRPAYRAHCFTASVANALCGIAPQVNMGSILNHPSYEALAGFRQLAAFRPKASSLLRLQVARHIKQLRREKTLAGGTVAAVAVTG